MAANLLDRTLTKLEFNKIRDKLARNTLTPMGREKAENLIPETELDIIRQLLQESTESRELLRFEPEVPFEQLRDIRPVLFKLDKGAVLEPDEILNVAKALKAGRRMKKFILDRKDKYPLLAEISTALLANQSLEEEIANAILDTGEIADNASPELRTIRSQMRSLQLSIKEKIDQILRSHETQKYLQENIVTIRGDRYVVPVKQEHRGQFPGIVHDQSASGATIFVEPMAVVEKNNQLRQLLSREKQEIIRILTYLSARISEDAENITDNVRALGHLDFALAKGRLSHELDCSNPQISNEGYLFLKKARHPLITGKVVPIDVWLGKSFDILVITGPNTGGKTVTLKTVGLLSLMAQAGLHIPAETGSSLSIFKKIFADIGDEQSIEQSLSTFSSHMTNIINILKNVNGESLILLDELGAGTDPAEGAALAMAILDKLDEKAAKVIATTHYSELKTFAFQRKSMENASVEFDIATLKPTYRLNIGRPGHSSAFDIAQGLGLDISVIERARNNVSHEQLEVSKLIQDLEANRRAVENELLQLRKQKKEVDNEKSEYQLRLSEIEAKKKELIDKARTQADSITKKARVEADQIIEELKAARDNANMQAANVARKKLRDLQSEMEEALPVKSQGKVPTKLKIGQQVYIPKLDQKGTVQSLADGNGEIQLLVGVMKISLPVKELRQIEDAALEVSKNNYSRIMLNKNKDIKNEIDLRGLTVDEALEITDKYLDDAALAGIPMVYLIHGKGTGALRSGITDFLNVNSHVKSFRGGQYGEGGTGVTVVELK